MYTEIRSKLLHNCTKAVISHAKINQTVKRKEIKSFLFKFVYVMQNRFYINTNVHVL